MLVDDVGADGDMYRERHPAVMRAEQDGSLPPRERVSGGEGAPQPLTHPLTGAMRGQDRGIHLASGLFRHPEGPVPTRPASTSSLVPP